MGSGSDGCFGSGDDGGVREGRSCGELGVNLSEC